MNIDMSNLLVAGGAVGNIIQKANKATRGSSYTKKGFMDSDIDFFVYGLSASEANQRVEKWIKDIIVGYDKYYANILRKTRTTRTVGPTLMVRTNDDTDDDNYKFATQFTCKLARNNNMIFIDIGNYKFQIILRLYNTISEILHGFDLGSCAVGFDGTTVFLTTLGKFCYEHMCNIV